MLRTFTWAHDLAPQSLDESASTQCCGFGASVGVIDRPTALRDTE